MNQEQEQQIFLNGVSGVTGGYLVEPLSPSEAWSMLLVDEVGYPAIVRPSFTLGGTGGGVAYNLQEYQDQVRRNAKAWGRALKQAGLDVQGDPADDFTETHQVLIRVAEYGPGDQIARASKPAKVPKPIQISTTLTHCWAAGASSILPMVAILGRVCCGDGGGGCGRLAATKKAPGSLAS